MSADLDKIAPALVAAQKGMRPVKQTATNPHFKSKFAPLSEVMDAAKEALNANDIAVLQYTDGEDAAGFNVVTMLLHVSGQSLTGRVRMPLEKGTAQASGSALSYGRRYGLATFLGIVAEDDDDGNAASQAMTPKKASKPMHERTPEDLAQLRTWAKAGAKFDLVAKIDAELARRELLQVER